jgi:hypothetical protein
MSGRIVARASTAAALGSLLAVSGDSGVIRF